MSIGRLLLAGRSLAGAHETVARYRVNKQALLPKFNSPKNPFVTPEQTTSPVQPAMSLSHLASERTSSGVPAEVAHQAGTVRSADGFVREKNFPAPKLEDVAVRAPHAVGARALRAARWLREWGQKLNPMQLLAHRRGPARLGASHFKQPAIQPELSLDTVKVVRNDLSDADLEVVLVTRPAAPDRDEQLVLASAGGREPSGNPFSRFSELVFGGRSA